jgi:acyl carrier protein
LTDFYAELAEILEVENVIDEDVLAEFDCWDSLTILSIIAFLNQNYKIQKSAIDIINCKSVRDIYALTTK